MTSEAAALTEQIAELLAEHRLLNKFEREGLNVAVHHACSCDEWSHTSGRNDWPELHRAHVAAEIAARLADSRPVVSEAAIEAAVKAMVQESNQFKPASYDRMARAALTAALPHMSDGKGEAEVIAEALEAWADELDKPPYDLWDRAAIPRLRARAASLRLSPTGDEKP